MLAAAGDGRFFTRLGFARDFGFVVSSSNEGGGADAYDAIRGSADGEWKPGDLDAIGNRLGGGGLGRSSGAAKGRVLYALGYFLMPGRWEPVGAVLLSIPSRKTKPLVVYRICLWQSLNDRDKVSVTALLIRSAIRVARETGRGGGRVHWHVHPGDAGQLCQAYGFKRRGSQREWAVLEYTPESA